jgi:hypothetical protein
VSSIEFSVACLQLSPVGGESADLRLGLIHGHMALCHVVAT